jgi:hypothetical protein
MSISTNKTPVNSISCSNSAINLSMLAPELRTKSQLNKIIICAAGNPDHLAINLYWDTFRSWYNPNKIYTKDCNVLLRKKLKTKGIYINYQKLSELHGVSKDTIRKKIIKLERLGLTNRSFQHKETATTKSYNQLIIYVWKKTPHFFNTLGVDKEEVINLNPQTNYKYIEEKHNIVFPSQTLQNNANQVKGGIRPLSGTKELIKPFSKEKDRSTKCESNFLENSFEEDGLKENRGGRASLNRNNFDKAKELKDFYPLTKEDCQILQSSSKREFSLNSMNEILLNMSKRLSNRYFKSKKGFLSYMSKVFAYEMRDAVKINNENFKIKNNQSKEEKEQKLQEEYLTKIEYNLETSKEWHFKKRIAARLPQKTAYELLKAFDIIDIKEGIFNLHLSKHVELTNIEEKLILQEAQSTHEQLDFTDERLGHIQNIKIIMPEKAIIFKNTNQNRAEETSIPTGIWGRAREKLIATYGKAIDNNWFSKLEAVENMEKNKLKLKAPNSFIKDWIYQNYFDVIEKLIGMESYKIEFC